MNKDEISNFRESHDLSDSYTILITIVSQIGKNIQFEEVENKQATCSTAYVMHTKRRKNSVGQIFLFPPQII